MTRTWTSATRAELRAQIVATLKPIPGYHAALLADPLTDAIEAIIAAPYCTGGPISTGALQYAVDSACDPTPFSSDKLQAPIAKMVALFTALDAAPEQTDAAVSASPTKSATVVFPQDPSWEEDLMAIIGQAESDLDAGVDEDVAYEKFLAALNASTPTSTSASPLPPVAGPAASSAHGPDRQTSARVIRSEIDDYTDATTLHDELTGKSVGPFLDAETIDDVSARPDAYFGDGTREGDPDRDGFLVELWIDTARWNEGHDMVCAPILTAYVATAHEADDVMMAIAAVAHAHAWTGFEARMRVAPSTARQRSVTDIVAEWTTWITGPGPTYVIP